MDVKTAFLNGDFKQNVYMTYSEGFVVEAKELGVQTQEIIYSLK